MKKIKLSIVEKQIEEALLSGEFVDVSLDEFQDIALAIKMKQKERALNSKTQSKEPKQTKNSSFR